MLIFPRSEVCFKLFFNFHIKNEKAYTIVESVNDGLNSSFCIRGHSLIKHLFLTRQTSSNAFYKII